MNTKLHAIADANGRPLSFFMTAGQVSDYTGAAALLDDMPKAQWLLGQVSTVRVRTIAQETSPLFGDVHHAAVRLPPAFPFDRHIIVGPFTSTWPSRDTPRREPITSTSASRAWIAVAFGHGWLERQEPSASRAAIPAMRRADLRRTRPGHHHPRRA